MSKQKRLPTLSEYCSQFCGNEDRAKFTYEQGYTAAENLLGRKIREQAVEIEQLQRRLGNFEVRSCIKCEFLLEVYEHTPKSNRDYWLATELFVFLHDGRDVCDKSQFQKTAMCSMPTSDEG